MFVLFTFYLLSHVENCKATEQTNLKNYTSTFTHLSRRDSRVHSHFFLTTAYWWMLVTRNPSFSIVYSLWGSTSYHGQFQIHNHMYSSGWTGGFQGKQKNMKNKYVKMYSLIFSVISTRHMLTCVSKIKNKTTKPPKLIHLIQLYQFRYKPKRLYVLLQRHLNSEIKTKTVMKFIE